MSDSSKPAVTSGIILGVIYVFLAVFAVPGELILQLAIPVVCGFLAIYLYEKKTPTHLGMGDGAKLGAKTGFYGGLILVIIGAPLLYFILSVFAGDVIRERLRSSGMELPFGGFPALVILVAVEAAIGVLLAIIGGLIGVPIFRKGNENNRNFSKAHN